jgi:hypothetical protein
MRRGRGAGKEHGATRGSTRPSTQACGQGHSRRDEKSEEKSDELHMFSGDLKAKAQAKAVPGVAKRILSVEIFCADRK